MGERRNHRDLAANRRENEKAAVQKGGCLRSIWQRTCLSNWFPSISRGGGFAISQANFEGKRRVPDHREEKKKKICGAFLLQKPREKKGRLLPACAERVAFPSSSLFAE